MENIPDPKYKIGDVVIGLNFQMLIGQAYYQDGTWKYYFENPNHRAVLNEDQIIKKLN